jgi:hypothetical protein
VSVVTSTIYRCINFHLNGKAELPIWRKAFIAYAAAGEGEAAGRGEKAAHPFPESGTNGAGRNPMFEEDSSAGDRPRPAAPTDPEQFAANVDNIVWLKVPTRSYPLSL